MKKLILPIAVGCLSVSFTFRPALPPDAAVTKERSLPKAEMIYRQLSLSDYGLSQQAFEYAWKGYEYLETSGKVRNKRYLTICDLSQSSRNERFYIIDISSMELRRQTYVAHGKNSGAEYATQFSNRPESLQSSLGFYVTGETYIGKHGLSLRLHGVDGSFNNNAYMRTIVIHGADYVSSARVQSGGYMGRSWGCPALPKNESAAIINMIRDGSCLFIYHPTEKYTTQSTILND